MYSLLALIFTDFVVISMPDLLILPQSSLWGLLRGIFTAVDGVAAMANGEEFAWSKFMVSPVLTGIIYFILDCTFPQEGVFLKFGVATLLESLLRSLWKIHHSDIPKLSPH